MREDQIEMSINLRGVQAEDEGFLFAVYASTRAEEMQLADWDAAQKEAFLRMQFNAQHQYYLENYPGAEFHVILSGEQPIGRLYLHRRDDELRIMDISLLPEYRRRGIGSTLLQEIMAHAANQNLPVTIHVEQFNPAQSLYQRLGFRVRQDKGVYLLMEWIPPMKERHELAG